MGLSEAVFLAVVAFDFPGFVSWIPTLVGVTPLFDFHSEPLNGRVVAPEWGVAVDVMKSRSNGRRREEDSCRRSTN